MNKTPHVHAALIKQWADGATIEVQMKESLRWVETGNPDWLLYCDYRVKPEPKPDVVAYGVARVWTKGHFSVEYLGPINTNEANNIKLVFDGETGKLKAVEKI